MTGLAMGFSAKETTLPDHRGARVARWVEDYIAVQKCSVAEVAFRIRQDRRDVQRLLDTRSCGHRLEDALAAYFGWPFVEAVMAPVIDTTIEAEIARERAEIAAREERLARLERARKGHRARSWASAAEDGPGDAPPRIRA